jgi:hypothetical protein
VLISNHPERVRIVDLARARPELSGAATRQVEKRRVAQSGDRAQPTHSVAQNLVAEDRAGCDHTSGWSAVSCVRLIVLTE